MDNRAASDRAGNSPIWSDDRRLVVAFQEGKTSAYSSIYDRYVERVGALCRRMLSSPDDAAEATQETFLRVYQALPRFNGRYRLGAWICRIATNVCLDVLRTRCRAPGGQTVPLDGTVEHLKEDDTAFDPEGSYLRKAERRRVRKTVAGLPPLHRAAIVLRDFEGLSYAEIASVLDLSEDRVKALLHRARGGFRRSWLSSLSSMFIPSKLWERLRGTADGPRVKGVQSSAGQGQLSEVVASSANVAASCSGVLQQCGQFVSERVAPLLVAAAVGAGGAGAAAASHIDPSAREFAAGADVASSHTGDRPMTHGGGDRRRARPAMSVHEDERPPTAQVEEAPADPPPTRPEPSPTPTPSPADQSSKEGKPSEQKPSSQSTSGPTVAIGFDRFGDVRTSGSSQHQLSLDCARRTLTQQLSAPISDGAATYEGALYLSVSNYVQLGLTVTKDGTEYEYRAWGNQPKVTWSDGGSSVTLLIEGEYGSVSGPAPSAAGLPDSGPFRSELKLDCASPNVLSETLVLGGTG